MTTEDDELEPATWEHMQPFVQAIGPGVSAIIKSVSERVGHELLEQKDTIYHYTDVFGLHGMIQGSKLWSTPTGYLNDTTEYHHGLNRIRKLIAEFIDYPEDGD